MFMSVISHILSAWFAFLLPCFSTYKALSHRPLSEPDLERWAMYWTVIAAFVTFEYAAEWFLSWFPFYWEIKTLFLLFLSLPQTQGSTFIYKTYLQPFFSKNEAELDEGITAAQNNVLLFVTNQLSALFNQLRGLSNQTSTSAHAGVPGHSAAPEGGPLDIVTGLWKSYAPSALSTLQKQVYSPIASTTSLRSTSSPNPGQHTPSISKSDAVFPPGDGDSLSIPSPSPAFPEPEIH